MNDTQREALEILEEVLRTGGIATTPTIMAPLLKMLTDREWTGAPKLLVEMLLTEHGYPVVRTSGDEIRLDWTRRND